MELAALAILGGAGYLLAQSTTSSAYPTKNPPPNPKARQAIRVKESFAPSISPSGGPSPTTGLGSAYEIPTSLRGNNPQLDLRYNDLMGRTPPPSQPNGTAANKYLPGGTISLTPPEAQKVGEFTPSPTCLLYTSDAADE